MHPRTREVRKPDSGIDPRGSGSGQPPLLQGFLKRHKRSAVPGAPPPEPTEATAAPKTSGAKASSAKAGSVKASAPKAGAAKPAGSKGPSASTSPKRASKA